MSPLEHLVRSGYRGIVLRLEYSHEDQYGMQEEVEEYKVFARARDGRLWRMQLTASSSGIKPLRYSLKQLEEIDEAHFAKSAGDFGGIQDTAAWYEKRAYKQKRILEIDREISALMPRCPDCDSRMAIRTNKRSGNQFYGCENFPECRGTKPLIQTIRNRLDQLQAERSRLL